MSDVASSTRHGAGTFRHVSIIGLGVMGGSLARALRALPDPPHVTGFSPHHAERDLAVASGALDEAVERAELAAACADLVVYALPLAAILDLQARHQSVWRPGAVVSDLSSLKLPVAGQARALGFGARCVSAHPMVGGEGSGFGASRDGLFEGATVWLSTAGEIGLDTKTRVERFWSLLGARPTWVDAATHDAHMVRVSHLPQMLANALALHLESHGLTRSELGSGGRDMTRLAGSSPTMWRDLLEHSAPELANALREMGTHMDAIAALLDAHDLDGVVRLMRHTQSWSEQGKGAS